MSERLGTGLQNRSRRFDSATHLITNPQQAARSALWIFLEPYPNPSPWECGRRVAPFMPQFYFLNTEHTDVTEHHPAHFDKTDTASRQLMTRNLRTLTTSLCELSTARASPSPWGGLGRGFPTSPASPSSLRLMVKRIEEVKNTATGTRRKKPELGSNFSPRQFGAHQIACTWAVLPRHETHGMGLPEERIA